jgi:hypothetical protein
MAGLAVRARAPEMRMIVECARCGDPLLPHMKRCRRCGGDNPSFVERKDRFWSSDLGIEAGLFGVGAYGLLVGGWDAMTAASGGGRLLGALSALLGAGAMIGFWSVHATQLTKAAKWSLRFAVVALLVVLAFIQAMIPRS